MVVNTLTFTTYINDFKCFKSYFWKNKNVKMVVNTLTFTYINDSKCFKSYFWKNKNVKMAVNTLTFTYINDSKCFKSYFWKNKNVKRRKKNVLFDDVTECRAFAVLVVSANSRNPKFFLSFKQKVKKKLSLTNVPIICLGLGFTEDNDTKI